MSWLEDAKINSLGGKPEKKTTKAKTKKPKTELPDYFVVSKEPKKTTGDLYTEFTAVLLDAGFILPDGLQETHSEEPHRCDTTDSKKGSKPAWYFFRLIGNAAFATYGDWRHGGHTQWASYANGAPSLKEIEHINETIRIQAEKAREEREKLADIAKRFVQTKINTLPRLEQHDYFSRKQINTIIPQTSLFKMGSKTFSQESYFAVVPMYNDKGEVVNWQRIDGNGEKRFKKYAKKQGHFHVLGDLRGSKSIVYCEGFATGASIYLSLSCAVIVCFDAGNILPVMNNTEEMVKGKAIYIAADNDVNEVGLEKAQAARDKHKQSRITMPPTVGTDFNDIWCEHNGNSKAVTQITEVFRKAGYEPPDEAPSIIWDGSESIATIPELISKCPTPKLQSLTDWFFSTAPKGTEQTAMLGAIVFACGLAGRSYIENDMGNYSPIQACLIAPSGAGKDFIKKGINTVLGESDVLEDLIGASSYTSGAAIRNALIQNPVKISVLDEFGDKLSAAVRGSGRDYESFEAFKELYSDCRGKWIGRGYAMLDPTTGGGKKDLRTESIVNPALTILGISTPQQFVSAINESHVEGGFLNRFIVVDVSMIPIVRKRRINLEIPDWIVKHCELVSNKGKDPHVMSGVGNLSDFSKTYSQKPDPRVVVFPEEVSDMLWQFDTFLDDQYGGNTLMANICTRWAENARRMAVGIAAFEDPVNPRVTVELINWCITYVQYHGKKLAALIDRHAHHDKHHKLRNECLEAIRAKKDQGMSKSEMNTVKPFRGMRLADRDEILNELQRQGVIATNVKGVEKGNKVVYYAIKSNS